MKDKFIQFLRKYKIALCAGITCVLVLAAVAAGMRGAVPAQAENSTTSVLNLLDGKQHPYLFVNEGYIEELKALKDNEYYATAYSAVSKKANSALPSQPEDGILSDEISRQLEAKAFMYMLGELSEMDAQATVAYTIEYLKNAKSAEETKQPINTISQYKDYGSQAIQTGALVYDWCYDIMTQNQRTELASYVKELMYADYQPCRPDNMDRWYDIADKAVGQPLIYNSIAAVALYDVYPELYNTIMPKVLGTMAEIVKIYGEAGALSDGSISYTREYYAYYVAVMLDRLGYDHELFYGDQVNIGYKMLYSRLPYGALLKQGDDFNQQKYVIGQYINGVETTQDIAILSAMYNDPYLKFQYVKENPNLNSLFSLLLTSSEIEPELPDELPLAFEVGEPKSEIMARTSWQDGLDSPAVVAYMNMNNRRTGDHDHSHMGEFQLYYKGPLTMSSGLYSGSGWGGTHWRNYYTRSISANCVTVYDPDEDYVIAGISAEANDGGQKGATAMWRLETNMSDANYLTETEATFIGPNKNTPAFSYIKGNLTNAYSENKMASYKRAMVFMDTFNEDYPGVMVVFDRVVSTNADFQKRWLLQAVTEPVVEGNKITITNTDEGCNGKLVNTTLYPQSVNIATVGGIGEFISDGQEWSIEYNQTMSDAYISGFRCEVSPTTAATEDIFLNAMYVTDADGNVADLPMTRVTTDEFMGVATLDRQVMFSKSGEDVSTAFSVNVVENGYEEVICLLTDVAAGKWTVAGNGMSVTVEVTEEEGSLVFTAKPGEYTVTPADVTAETTDMTWEEAEKEKIGDFAMKIGTVYTYVKNPNRVVDGKPYIAIADFMERFFETTTETNGKTLTVTLKNGKTLIFNAGSKEYTMKNGDTSTQGTLIYEPFLDANGVFYLNCSGISHHLGFNVNYSEKTKVMQIAVLLDEEVEGVDSDKVLWPIAVTASTDDGNIPENLIDRNLGTRWSSVVADGEWACFDLGAEMEISSVQIAFYNYALENNWNFDIQISSDGVTFTDVLTGKKSNHATQNAETFELPEGTKARYVRYVGHGVHRKDGYFKGYYNSVTEFRINK